MYLQNGFLKIFNTLLKVLPLNWHSLRVPEPRTSPDQNYRPSQKLLELRYGYRRLPLVGNAANSAYCDSVAMGP